MTGSGDITAAETVAAHKVLSGVAAELSKLAEMSERLQIDISELLKEHNDASSLKVYKLQNLDHITQLLSGLAAYMNEIAGAVPRDWPIDAAKAAQAILLADLASRLSHARDGELPPHETNAGNCSLF